ncbi:MAG: tRNA pseudouridine(38-40) synthase TruA [Planctomycetes bacterium]|nr:tRNA pseudouridine(38-40) synthase TruA [Planctomycetota bacterium]
MTTRNVRLLIEYEGTNYSGWQWQKNTKTVQETLTDAIRKVLQEDVKIHGAGRTDAGVHALGQVANFETHSKIPAKQLLRAINSYLPHDITIKEVSDIEDSFHAQYSAKSKIYQYTLLNDWIRTSLNRNFCHVYGFPLDMSKMIMAARCLIGTHDFTSFTTKAFADKNRIRTIKNLEIRKEGKYIYFLVEADGFLYKMVRTIVGTLLEVGRERMDVSHIKNLLMTKKRKLAGPVVPAKGLCLKEVKY